MFYAGSAYERDTYLNRAIEKKYITANQTHSSYEIGLLPDGLDFIQPENNRSKDIFVAMEFNENMLKIFDNEFKKQIEDKTNSYKLCIISEIQHNNDINDEIISHINGSRAVIADFSDNNSGAYYEAGYAHGKGIDVIFICKKEIFEQSKKPHFDIEHRNFILWEDKNDLRTKLINRINATL